MSALKASIIKHGPLKDVLPQLETLDIYFKKIHAYVSSSAGLTLLQEQPQWCT